MITGVGFPELLLVFVLVLLFFGSNELPRFIRMAGRLIAKARQYSDLMRKELDEVNRPVRESLNTVRSSVDTAHTGVSLKERKDRTRREFRQKRKELTAAQREVKSRAVCEFIAGTPHYRDARALMVYMALDDEVDLRSLITRMKHEGKRIVLPCCEEEKCELKLGEVSDVTRDCHPCTYGIREPLGHLRDNFLKSDIDMVICPGVAFDKKGTRLGQGKHYYDSFLEELKGRIPVYGVAFQCQIAETSLPRDPYTDVKMDEIITENGPLLGNTGASRQLAG
jgi:5-formyltetrahydrofolate cyclo-ligase